MGSRPHPFVPLQPSKLVLPRGIVSSPPASNARINTAAAPFAVRAPRSKCFNCGQADQFARECPNCHQARKPPSVPHEPTEVMKTTIQDFIECIAEACSEVHFCVNCGMVDNVVSQCVESPVSYNFANSRWAETEAAGVAAHTEPRENNRLLMLQPAKQPTVYTPLAVNCGSKQVQMSLEPTTFDRQGRTCISNHLMLAAEQQYCPGLTFPEL